MFVTPHPDTSSPDDRITFAVQAPPSLHASAAAATPGLGPVVGSPKSEQDALRQHIVEIHAQLHAEQLRSRQRDLEVAKLVHDLRGPLNGVLGSCSLLRTSPPALETNLERWLCVIETSGSHMLRLLEDVLTQARVDAGRLRMVPAPIVLRETMQSTVAMLADHAAYKGLSLSLHLERQVPAVVKADETILRRILLNLLCNAINYTSSGGVRVSVRTAQPRHLRVEVQDDGPGMNESHRIELFARGAHAEAQAPGSGIGLCVVRDLVRRMGGELHVESPPGHGSTFWFEWEALEASPTDRPSPSTT